MGRKHSSANTTNKTGIKEQIKEAIVGKDSNKSATVLHSTPVFTSSTTGTQGTVLVQATTNRVPIESSGTTKTVSGTGVTIKKTTKKTRGRPKKVDPARFKQMNGYKSVIYKGHVMIKLYIKDKVHLEYIQNHPEHNTKNSADLTRKLWRQEYERLKNLK